MDKQKQNTHNTFMATHITGGAVENDFSLSKDAEGNRIEIVAERRHEDEN